ncbi:MAG TPA: DUF2914 domain-containing protein [Candidatus Polarisedimenticolaceae bacterium]|nr:DUF2914 domain-containing protein [Candidatus Polarisedimenticolaceae bacterium]
MEHSFDWRERLRGGAASIFKWNLVFFVAGFAFDVVATRAGVDHTLLIVQQIAYLAIIGGILYVDFVREERPDALPMPRWIERPWAYRSFVFHFCLGTLMNLYSIFFLMSASLFSSSAFVAILFGAIWLNELHTVRRGLDVKVALYVLCVFCFWSLLIPILLHSISRLTFLLSFAATLAVLAGFVTALRPRIGRARLVGRLVNPGVAVSVLFLLMYWVGLIPPVPIAARTMGVYHRVERVGDQFRLSYESSWTRPWRYDDRRFVAEPGDVVSVFFAIFAPTRFDDTVFVRWSFLDRTSSWKDSDRIPIRITGGRDEGFRGVATKENYTPGAWRAIVETRDGREIARLRFTITEGELNPARVFKTETY